jgi:outer membrane receptor for ferrienterochelin and colicin
MLPVQYLHKSSRSRRRGSSFAALTLSALAAALSAAAHAQQVGEAKTDTEQAKAKQADAKVLEAVVITGTNIRSANLVSSAPITEVGKAIFEGTGSISIEDTLSRIPSITAGLSASSNNTSTGGDAANVGVATVSLRNLGSARTLVLVNGRRWVSGVSANTGYGVDLNSIPVAMIKRVDVQCTRLRFGGWRCGQKEFRPHLRAQLRHGQCLGFHRPVEAGTIALGGPAFFGQ